GACGCSAAGDCPTGTACDPTTRTCTASCSSTRPCNGGCCTAASGGTCVTGTSDAQCATTPGGVCEDCNLHPAGHVCGVPSGANQCGCGTRLDCPPGRACGPTGTCTASCDASHLCNGGCCSGGVCTGGTSAGACGTSGASCADCSTATVGHGCMA